MKELIVHPGALNVPNQLKEHVTLENLDGSPFSNHQVKAVIRYTDPAGPNVSYTNAVTKIPDPTPVFFNAWADNPVSSYLDGFVSDDTILDLEGPGWKFKTDGPGVVKVLLHAYIRAQTPPPSGLLLVSNFRVNITNEDWGFRTGSAYPQVIGMGYNPHAVIEHFVDPEIWSTDYVSVDLGISAVDTPIGIGSVDATILWLPTTNTGNYNTITPQELP